MKILLTHNCYQITGGEDGVLNNETLLLKQHNNEIENLTVDNKAITTWKAKIFTMIGSTFSLPSYKRMKKKLLISQPDIVHVHNYFPILSPSIFYACNKAKVPVVHTLHNYRAICPTSLLMFENKIIEKSMMNSAWWAVRKKVYRNSLIGTFALSLMVEMHKKFKTWHNKVDRYIALTEFARSKYIEAGWPAEKIVVKPNFIEDPIKNMPNSNKTGGYALFVGRLSEEKGIEILFDAWGAVGLPLKVIGEGPLQEFVENKSVGKIQYLGHKEKKDVLDLVKNADFIIMPSTWYEGFPMVLVEAFACGTPAIVSRLGSMEEIIEHKVTGLHFEPGNPVDLAKKVQWMADNAEQVREMGINARQQYLDKYTPDKNYEMLMDIYQQAIDEAKKR